MSSAAQNKSSIPVLTAAGVALGGVCLSMGTGIYMLAVDSDSETLLRLLFIGAIIAVFAVAGTGSLIIIRRGMFRLLMYLGLALALCAMGVWIRFAWIVGDMMYREEELLARLGGTFAIGTLAITLFGQIMSMRTSSSVLAGMRMFFICLFELLALSSILMIWWGEGLDHLLPTYTSVALGIGFGVAVPTCLVGLSLVPALIRRDNRRRAIPRESVGQRAEIQAACPQCCEEQIYRTGLNRCKSCGFALMIEFEEPRCECGYLLYRLVGTVCPECGREVTARQQWVGAEADKGEKHPAATVEPTNTVAPPTEPE